MVQNMTLNGQGHFFYVANDGKRYFDYGLDLGTYSAQIPEFGFRRHFTPLGSLVSTFNDLFMQEGLVLHVLAMARVISSTIPVQGWVVNPPPFVMPLSWVTVEAANGTISRSVPTLDGLYDGQGAINLPAGTYNITFSVAFYEPQTHLNIYVQWNGDYPVPPPEGFLCPTADPSVCLSPSPLSISQTPTSLQLTSNIQTVPLSVGFISATYVTCERKNP
jgi:hypothetical protein